MARDLSGSFGTQLANQIKDNASGLIQPWSQLAEKAKTGFSQQGKLLGLSSDVWKYGSLDTIGDTEKLLNATGNVASKYLQAKIDRIKDAWNTKVEISLNALLGEVTPFVKNPKEAVSLLVDKIDDLVEYLLGVDGSGGNDLKSLIDDIGTDALEFMMADSSMQQVMSNLSVVKTFGQVLNTYNKIESMVTSILSVVEPLIPVLQIATNLASSYFSGGTSTAEAAQEMTELITKYSQQLIALAAGALRKYVFSIKIKLPSLVVGALNSLSVREAILTGDYEYEWLKSIFDEDFYNQTLYSLQWQDSINTAINTTLGSYAEIAKNNLSLNFTNSKGESITRGEFMKSKFMSTLTSSFMSAARASARKTAYISDVSERQYQTKKETYDKHLPEISESDNISVSATISDVVKENNKKKFNVNSIDTIISLSAKIIS